MIVVESYEEVHRLFERKEVLIIIIIIVDTQ
jgi:hypothetical protein